MLLWLLLLLSYPPLSTSCHIENVGKDGKLGGLRATGRYNCSTTTVSSTQSRLIRPHMNITLYEQQP
jgi:hypothetical protein